MVRAQKLSTWHSPELERPLSGTGDQQGAIGAKSEVRDSGCLAAERVYQFPRGDGPELHGFVGAGRGQDRAIGAKSYSDGPGDMAVERTYNQPALHVPQLDRAVLTRCGQGFAVRTKGDRSHRRGMPAEDMDRLPAL